MNHNREFDKKALKTKYAIFSLLIFILFSLFSYQSVAVVSSSSNSIFVGSTPYVSPDYSEVAYVSSLGSEYQNNPYYLVVTNLVTGKSASYKICLPIDIINTCLSAYHQFSVYKYNESTFIIKVATYNPDYYLYNTLTKEIFGPTIFNQFFYIGNSTHEGYLSGYLNQSVLNFIDLATGLHSTINIPGLRYSGVNSYILSPDLTKLAIFSEDLNGTVKYILNFYDIYNSNAILVNSTKIANVPPPIFLPWIDNSVVYFTGYNSSLTYLDSFNFTSSVFKTNFVIPKYVHISNVDTNYSSYITDYPVQIYSLKNNELLSKTSFDQGIWDSSLTKAICWNYNEIKLVNFNPTTNTVTTRKTIDATLDSSVIQILNIIEYSNFICTGILIVAVIVLSKKEGVSVFSGAINPYG